MDSNPLDRKGSIAEMLHCTLVPAPGSTLQASVELAVDAPQECSGVDLQRAISRRYGTGELSVDGALLRTLGAGGQPLRNGAVLVDGAVPVSAGGGTAASRGGPAAPRLFLAVHSGPSAGTVVPLRRGHFRIGRSGTDLVIPDAELSREHARLEVSDAAVMLVDLHSANGTTVDGQRVRRAAVTTDSVIRCGSSTMSLLFAGDFAATRISETAGSSVAEPLDVSGPSNNTIPGSGRSTVLLIAALPLAVGVGLAVFTGSWMFLALSLASAMSLLLPAVSGRKRHRELKVALDERVHEDRERRRRSAPSAAELFASATLPEQDREARRPVQPSAVVLRLGLAEQQANLLIRAAGPEFRPPPLGLVPLTLGPETGLTTIDGPSAAVAGLVRSVLMQLASYPAACRTWVLVHGLPEHLPLAARFLPRVTLSCQLSTTAARLDAGPGPGCDRGVFIILSAPDEEPSRPHADTSRAAGLGTLASGKGWQVLQCGSPPGPPDGASIILRGHSARLTRGQSGTSFVPDLVPYPAFDNFCRRLGFGGTPQGEPPDALTATVPLAGLLPLGATEIGRRWVRSSGKPGLPVPVGSGEAGTVRVDIERDGPHLLVAGTTGSGKSEFLRTLVASLAASYPPDRINLLFIDFKGGSGLGPLTGLPHCVGMLTDLGLQEVDRTLVSLRAEVRRREELLASAHAGDLGAYRSVGSALPTLPHLVVVIDEFRMLVDEAPHALTELMRIAAIGRSLGIHLIMATQRPQGSVTADIRANVTSRVALRVQSAMESMDVMNSSRAVDLPIAAPGRAFLVKGAEEPREFQTATLGPGLPPPSNHPVTVLAATEWLGGAPVEVPAEAEPTGGGRSPETALVEATGMLWAASGGKPPRPPVAAALPPLLPFPSSGTAGGPPPAGPRVSVSVPAGTVRLGWLDIPERQRLAELCWHPEADGHLGFVGGPAGSGVTGSTCIGGGVADGRSVGGMDEAVVLAVAQLLVAEQESHLYILDAAGSFHAAAGSPRVGAVAGPHEAARVVRVLERLAGEMARRLSGPRSQGPRLVLAVTGWGTWVSAFRSGPLGRGEDLVQDLVRDGAKAGIAVLISGERELTTSRFFAGIANRIFFPAGCSDEARLTWPRLPAMEALPGRVAVQGPFLRTPSETPHIGQLYQPPLPGLPDKPPVPLRQAPFRVEALPPRIRVPEVLARIGGLDRAARQDPGLMPELGKGPAPRASGSPPRVRLFFGLGGDQLAPASLTLRAGSVLAALGGPGTGKTALLAALVALNSPAGGWLQPGPGKDPAEYWAGLHAKALAGALHPEAVLLADDVDLQSDDCNRQLSGLNSLGWTVVLTAGFSPVLQQRVPLVQRARRDGGGILICPRSLVDGDLFGVRFELEANPPPGRAVLVSNGRTLTVQLAEPAPAAARRR